MKTEPATSIPVVLDCDSTSLNADLSLPAGAPGLIVFAHGSGSSRHSSRNRAVAHEFVSAGLGTLLLDLLTHEEEREDNITRAFRFDIPLLGRRVVAALDWATFDSRVADLALGLFGASTGAAAALVAAADRSHLVRAVVSRGGRPDLAGPALEHVAAPTLLIVGGHDDVVLDLNRQALERLRAEKALRIVPGATHLFEEPGALDEVANLAKAWFIQHLT